MSDFRTCVVCKFSDFHSTMERVSTRRYRHSERAAERCAYIREHPGVTLQQLFDLRIPGVSFLRGGSVYDRF